MTVTMSTVFDNVCLYIEIIEGPIQGPRPLVRGSCAHLLPRAIGELEGRRCTAAGCQPLLWPLRFLRASGSGGRYTVPQPSRLLLALCDTAEGNLQWDLHWQRNGLVCT